MTIAIAAVVGAIVGLVVGVFAVMWWVAKELRMWPR